jgi:hypothetical protein
MVSELLTVVASVKALANGTRSAMLLHRTG